MHTPTRNQNKIKHTGSCNAILNRCNPILESLCKARDVGSAYDAKCTVYRWLTYQGDRKCIAGRSSAVIPVSLRGRKVASEIGQPRFAHRENYVAVEMEQKRIRDTK